MRSSFRTVATLVAIPLAGMAIFFFWQFLNDGVTPHEVAREVPRALRGNDVSDPPPQHGPEAAAPAEEERRARPRPKRKRPPATPDGPLDAAVVLIIDDLGFEGQPLERVMSLDPNVTCSVLPNATATAAVAAELHQRGFEILCHLPMEPRGRERPGRGAVLTAMSDAEIAATTVAGIAAVPNARGVNNHMGSLATADRRVMSAVLRALPAELFFIDSRTAGNSIAGRVASELGIPNAGRHVFLDDVATESFVRQQLAELVSIASREGVAIGIGHPYAATLRVLEEELPRLRARGLRVIRASEAVAGGT